MASGVIYIVPNGCGPMWRVSERDERKEAQRSYIDLHEKFIAAEARVKAMRGALEKANLTLVRAFNRIHTLPRSSDTALADEIERVRAKIGAALASAQEADHG